MRTVTLISSGTGADAKVIQISKFNIWKSITAIVELKFDPRKLYLHCTLFAVVK